MSEHKICDVIFSDFLVQMEEFHGYRSPGILVGGLMLDVALREMKPTPYLNVVTETVVCLPDAVQLLTPCTFGNGFLQVLDWGKFALACYDRDSLSGIRVWLNPDSLENYPLIRQWFQRSPHSDQKPPFEELSSEIFNAKDDLLDYRSVILHKSLKDSKRVPTGRCKECGEFYPLRHGTLCPACQGQAYYDLKPNPIHPKQKNCSEVA